MASIAVSPCARPKLADWRSSSGELTISADLPIYQGDGFAAVVEILDGNGDPADLTGYSALAQIRKGPADLFPEVTETITTTISSPNVVLSLTASQTSKLTNNPLFWDLELTDAEGMPTTVLSGNVVVTLEISRPVPPVEPLLFARP